LQGGPLSPLLANVYLNDIDKMLEKAKRVTKTGPYTHLTYARFKDDIVICVDEHRKWEWLYNGVKRRLYEELEKLEIPVNTEKSKEVNLTKKESFDFLGFTYRRVITRKKKIGVMYSPKMKKRTELVQKLKKEMRSFRSQPARRMISKINPILRGWVNYFRIGTSSRTFQYIKDWVIKKVRRHLMRQRKRKGFGWSRWNNKWIYDNLELYSEYKIIRYKDL